MKEGDRVRLTQGRVSTIVYAKGETGVITEVYPRGSKYFCCVKMDDNVRAFEEKYGTHLKALGYTLQTEMPDSLIKNITERCFCFFRNEIEAVTEE